MAVLEQGCDGGAANGAGGTENKYAQGHGVAWFSQVADPSCDLAGR